MLVQVTVVEVAAGWALSCSVSWGGGIVVSGVEGSDVKLIASGCALL